MKKYVGLIVSGLLLACSAFADIDIKGDLSGVWRIEGKGLKLAGPSTLVIRKTDKVQDFGNGYKSPYYEIELKDGAWVGRALAVIFHKNLYHLVWGIPDGSEMEWENTMILKTSGDILTLGGDVENYPLGTMTRISTQIQ